MLPQWVLTKKVCDGIKKCLKADLNAGNGDPWAGQSRARLVEIVSVNPWKSDFCENFGFAPPIGSECKRKK